MDAMIDALTKGIGVEVGRPLRLSYFQLKQRLQQNEKYQGSDDHVKIALLDLLALSIFHHQVIVPFYGANNFRQGSRQLGIKDVRVGGKNLGKEFFALSDKIPKAFFKIVSDYGIAVEKLHVSTISEFTDYWLGQMRSRRG